jgi:hypothetical protein
MTEKCVPANVTTYNALLKGLQYKNMAEKDFEIMEWMRNERCMPDYVTMDVLMEWLSDIGETDRLKHFIQQKEGS